MLLTCGGINVALAKRYGFISSIMLVEYAELYREIYSNNMRSIQLNGVRFVEDLHREKFNFLSDYEYYSARNQLQIEGVIVFAFFKNQIFYSINYNKLE